MAVLGKWMGFGAKDLAIQEAGALPDQPVSERAMTGDNLKAWIGLQGRAKRTRLVVLESWSPLPVPQLGLREPILRGAVRGDDA